MDSERKSWCTWHNSHPTCIQHRPCSFCNNRPLLQGPGNINYCMDHAQYDRQEKCWKPKTETADLVPMLF